MKNLDLLQKGVVSSPITEVYLPKTDLVKNSNGGELYFLKSENLGVLKFEIIFEAGKIAEKIPLTAHATSKLLFEGTSKFSSKEISEKIDFYGGYVHSYCTNDLAIIKLECSTIYATILINLIFDVLQSAIFSNKELSFYKKQRIESLQLNLTKNKVKAYRTITEKIFGTDTPYGYNSSFEAVSQLERGQIVNHFLEEYTADSASYFLSGDFNSEIIDLILKRSVEIKGNLNSKISKQHPLSEENPQTIKIDGRIQQSCLYLGRGLFDRSHSDYFDIIFLNSVLGGYFGSRLVKNIREEKGFTYGISSFLDMNKYTGALLITCELDKQNIGATMKEIDKEFERLKTEPLENEELQMVKNYMLGSIMNSINGPFKSLSITKLIKTMNLHEEYFIDFIESIISQDKEAVLQTAKKYLITEKFWKVIVGEHL